MAIESVPFEIGGVIFDLKFGMGAQVQFERLTGKRLTELEENMSMETIAQILWVMIRRSDEKYKSIKLDEVCDMIDNGVDSLDNITGLITEVVQAAYPSETETKNSQKPTSKKTS